MQGTSIKESPSCCIVHMPEGGARYVELWKWSQNEKKAPALDEGRGCGACADDYCNSR
ncbi:hypothetical protein NUKP55_05130 [Klebsiella variicola]|nr:hypothetical protein NUKP55_05130 [Klebsiella variicola]